MRVVVTGGAGFIGRHLVRALADRGDDVLAVDDLSGDSCASAHELQGVGVSLVVQDVHDELALARLFVGSDVVVHLASSVRIRGGETDPERDMHQVVLGTHSVLEAVRRSGVPHLCFASSGAVYGEQAVRPTPEDVPLRPISLYGAAKAAAESFIGAYAHLYGLSATVFRFGNVLGPGLRRGVVYDFVSSLRRNGDRLVVLGDGRQRKAYIAVEDCVSGVMGLGLEAAGGVETFNLSADGTVGVMRIARGVVEAMELGGTEIVTAGGANGWPGDVPELDLSSRRARRSGWHPRYVAAEAVDRAIATTIAESEAWALG